MVAVYMDFAVAGWSKILLLQEKFYDYGLVVGWHMLNTYLATWELNRGYICVCPYIACLE